MDDYLEQEYSLEELDEILEDNGFDKLETISVGTMLLEGLLEIWHDARLDYGVFGLQVLSGNRVKIQYFFWQEG